MLSFSVQMVLKFYVARGRQGVRILNQVVMSYTTYYFRDASQNVNDDSPTAPIFASAKIILGKKGRVYPRFPFIDALDFVPLERRLSFVHINQISSFLNTHAANKSTTTTTKNRLTFLDGRKGPDCVTLSPFLHFCLDCQMITSGMIILIP